MFFVLDKKFQTYPLNAIQLDAITVPQECVNQCYNIQVPLLTYKNIPMQISPMTGTNNVMQNDTISSMNKETNTKPDIKVSDPMQEMNKLSPNGTIRFKKFILTIIIFTYS